LQFAEHFVFFVSLGGKATLGRKARGKDFLDAAWMSVLAWQAGKNCRGMDGFRRRGEAGRARRFLQVVGGATVLEMRFLWADAWGNGAACA
jgi:hypothetical protein